METRSIEGFYVEINRCNDKWLINRSYNPHKNMINHLRALSEKLHKYSSSFNKFIILGDFNAHVEEQQIRTFCDNYGLKSLTICHNKSYNAIPLALTKF